MQQDTGLKHVLRCTERHRFYDTVIYWAIYITILRVAYIVLRALDCGIGVMLIKISISTS